MTRQKLLNALLIATFGAVAATAAAAQTPTGQNDTPRNAPTGTAPEPAVQLHAVVPGFPHRGRLAGRREKKISSGWIKRRR